MKKRQFLPPDKSLLQIYKITRQKIAQRKITKEDGEETYDEAMTRMIEQYILARRH
jgi:hypothetical protein